LDGILEWITDETIVSLRMIGRAMQIPQ
jgi:hypothetical protein